MGTPGKLTKDQFGYSMPPNAPLYNPFPVHYRDARVLSISYLTDLEAAAALLPSQLELSDTPVATAIFADYPWSTVGNYKEVAQVVSCTYQGRDVVYAVHFHVTTAAAMSAGREIAGFPKKIGHIEFEIDEMYSSYLDRPKDVRICTGIFTPVRQVEGALPAKREYVSLRVMPNPQDAAQPSLSQLIGTEWVLGPGEIWGGIGQCHFTGASPQDPYHALPVVKTLESSLFVGSMAASAVTFVEDI